MRRELLVVLALALGPAGCYRPGFGECQVVCGERATCPYGMSCQGDGYCHGNAAAKCGTGWRVLATAPVAAHACAIRGDGALFCWGENGDGQLGVGDAIPRRRPARVGTFASWKAVGVGARHSCAVRDDGSLWCWGANDHGQVGDGGVKWQYRPVTVDAGNWKSVAGGDAHSCGVGGDDSLWCWGANDKGQLGDPQLAAVQRTPRRIGTALYTAVAAGPFDTAAIREDGSLWGFGLGDGNRNGAGASSTAPVATPEHAVLSVSLGAEHGCALGKDGSLACFGADPARIGASGSATRAQVGGAGEWLAVAAGDTHTCAVRRNGSLACFGESDRGALGQGTRVAKSAIPKDVDDGVRYVAVGAGLGFTCALRKDGHLACFGDDAVGELGDGGGGPFGTPVEIPGAAGLVATGTSHTCAAGATGARCFGKDDFGEAGDGGGPDRLEPVDVAGDLPALTALAAGQDHGCFIEAAGALFCFGRDEMGQLGDGRSGKGTMAGTPLAVAAGTHFTAVGAGGYATCAIDDRKILWCFGDGQNGRLGDGTGNSSTVPVALTGTWKDLSLGPAGSCAIRDPDGKLLCWGLFPGGIASFPRELPGSPLRDLVAISVGGSADLPRNAGHACMIDAQKNLWCVGANDQGQLGTGTTSGTTPLTRVDGSWRAVAAGGAHTCAIGDDGSLSCWGQNRAAQTGRDPSEPVLSPARVGTDTGWTAVAAGASHTCALQGTRLFCFGDAKNGRTAIPAAVKSAPVLVAEP